MSNEHQKASISLPPWLPLAAAITVRRLEERNPPPEHLPILQRLACDRRMKTVWNELIKRSGGRGRDVLGEVLFLAFHSAGRDDRRLIKFEAVAVKKAEMLAEAATARRMADHMDGSQADAMRDGADQWERQVNLLCKADDPKVAGRFRGDPLVAGVARDLGMFFQQTFGTPLLGTAGRIAAVACGTDWEPARAVRSGL